MRNDNIGIIVLAAGASTRMGAPKQLLQIGGVSLIRRAAQTAVNSGCHPVIVVLGANATLIQPELAGLNTDVVVNPDWEAGLSASIRCGINRLLVTVPNPQGVVLMVADQPGVSGSSLEKIMLARAGTPDDLVAARFHDVCGTPAFFSRKYFGALQQLVGTDGARHLLKEHREQVVAVDLPEAAQDLDTPQDVADFRLTEGPASTSAGQTRREFVRTVTTVSAGLMAAPALLRTGSAAEPPLATPPAATTMVPLKLRVNGTEHSLSLDPRTTLLDVLRERLNLTGSKKGCDHGQCGACTVLVNGRRINACLALAIVHEGDDITTIEGLANGENLHPVQQAFWDHDGFQCGYCTSGQICSAVALLKEGHANSDPEIREWMSGNLCRCGAYPNIVAAIREAKTKTAII